MPRKKILDDKTILQCAFEVILKVGASDFNLQDLSKKTGLSPSTLIQRFGSKKNILLEAIKLARQNLKEDLNKITLSHKSPTQQIINIYLEPVNLLKSPESVAKTLDLIKLEIKQKKLKPLVRDFFRIRRKKIKVLIIAGQKEQEIRSNLNSLQIISHLETLWHGSIVLWALIGKNTAHEWLKKELHFFLKLCGGNKLKFED
jgi:AcrR family transcriptional regulator